MSKITLSTEQCAKCRHTWEQNIYESVNVTQEPELKQLVVTGDVFRVKCPSCGHITPRPHFCVYHDMEKQLMIALTNPGQLDSSVEALKKSLDDAPGFSAYHLRVTTAVPDFIEKVLAFEAGLNDGVVELCKIVLPQQSPELQGAQFRFQAIDDNGALAFAVLRPNQRPEFVTVPRDYYEAVRTKAFADLATKAEVRGEWQTIDFNFVGAILMSRKAPQ